jgi:hypothetical protein
MSRITSADFFNSVLLPSGGVCWHFLRGSTGVVGNGGLWFVNVEGAASCNQFNKARGAIVVANVGIKRVQLKFILTLEPSYVT